MTLCDLKKMNRFGQAPICPGGYFNKTVFESSLLVKPLILMESRGHSRTNHNHGLKEHFTRIGNLPNSGFILSYSS